MDYNMKIQLLKRQYQLLTATGAIFEEFWIIIYPYYFFNYFYTLYFVF